MSYSIGAYGIALELCFVVNLVVSLWGDLRKRIVAGQNALDDGRASLDQLAASESQESIAMSALEKTLKRGRRWPNVLWILARAIGAAFAVIIYIAVIEVPHDLPFDEVVLLPWDVTLWPVVAPLWWLVELAAAYLSATLVITMAVLSLCFRHSAKKQIKALEDALHASRRINDKYEAATASLSAPN